MLSISGASQAVTAIAKVIKPSNRQAEEKREDIRDEIIGMIWFCASQHSIRPERGHCVFNPAQIERQFVIFDRYPIKGSGECRVHVINKKGK